MPCATRFAWNAVTFCACEAITPAASDGLVGVYVGGSSPAAVTKPSHDGMNDTSNCPPVTATSRYESLIGTMGNAARNPAGCCAAEDLVDRAVRGAVQPDAAVRPRALQRRRPLRQLVAVALLARAERRPCPF